MNNHIATRIPINNEYAALLGRTIYAFAYYEGTIIDIVERLSPGFKVRYYRERQMTSRVVCQEWKNILDDKGTIPNSIREVQYQCCDEFDVLIEERNALIHAHPITHEAEGQILFYQSKTTKKISDKTWLTLEIENLITKIDQASINTSKLFDRIR